MVFFDLETTGFDRPIRPVQVFLASFSFQHLQSILLQIGAVDSWGENCFNEYVWPRRHVHPKVLLSPIILMNIVHPKVLLSPIILMNIVHPKVLLSVLISSSPIILTSLPIIPTSLPIIPTTVSMNMSGLEGIFIQRFYFQYILISSSPIIIATGHLDQQFLHKAKRTVPPWGTGDCAEVSEVSFILFGTF